MIQTVMLIYIIGCFISSGIFTITYNKFLQYTEKNKTDFCMMLFIVTILSWIVPIILFIDYIIAKIKIRN